jgi:hypothetical protein
MRHAIETLIVLIATACGGSHSPARAPAEEPTPSSAEPAPQRAELTAEACEAGGGSVVGDIGDGAIHRADYRCPSGAAPSGNIRPAEGGPIAVEGSVCCPK